MCVVKGHSGHRRYCHLIDHIRHNHNVLQKHGYTRSHVLAHIILQCRSLRGWLGSRVVSVLDSGAEGPGFKSQPRRCRVSLRRTVHRASVHQAANLVAALLTVQKVTAGLAESSGSLPPAL